MKTVKKWIPLGLVTALSLTAVCPAYAAGTEFSRTAEEWEKLQDNVLEYGEIADLIHEYNATVNKNAIDLNEFRKKYGVTNTQWSDRYRELASKMYSAVSEPDAEDPSYISIKMEMISNEMNAKQLQEKADDALEDYQVKYYDYQVIELGLAADAQTKMIEYYQKQIKLSQDENQLKLLQETYGNMLVKKKLGSVTETEILLQQEKIRQQEKTILDDRSGIENTRQSLLVMLGWKHDDQPEIREVPEPSEEQMASVNPEQDKAAAIENSYAMKSLKKQLENARTQTKRDDLERTIREKNESIGTAVSAAYMDLLAKKAAYEMSLTQAALEEKNLGTSNRQLELGNVSRMQNLTQQITTENAKLSVETARLNLIQSFQKYENLRNGAAG